MRVSRRTFLKFAALGGIAGATQAQTVFPRGPVRLIVPFPPGGPVDVTARALAQRLTELWSQQVAVENRSGGNSVIGAEAAARAAPDGHTIFVGAIHQSVLPGFGNKLPYDLENDFTPVSGLDLYGNGIITSRQFARGNPDTVAAVVRGYVMGMRATIANPAEAIDHSTRTVKGDVGWDAEVERYRPQLIVNKLYNHPTERRAFGVGGLDKKRLEVGIRQVAEGFGMPSVPNVADVFDDRFLPPLAERM